MTSFRGFCILPVAVAVLCAMAAAAWAAQVPVFDYQFPASWDGTDTFGTCYDLSTAGNRAVMENNALVYPGAGYAPDERPPGFVSGGSLWGGDSNGPGCGRTENTLLLANNLVAANGGFSYDAWIKPVAYPGTGTAAPYYIDYAGTEVLMLNRTGTSPNFSYRFQFKARDGWYNVYSDPIDLTKWYHVQVSFDAVGLAPLSTNEQSGLVVMVVEDPVAGVSNTYYTGMTKTVLGDNQNRGIGLNRHSNPTITDITKMNKSPGYLFNPKVNLGPDPGINAQSLLVPVNPTAPGHTVGHWALNEAAGATTVVDSGPNGLHGTAAGDVTMGEAGAKPYSGTAIGTNLDGGTDDCVDIPFNEAFNSDSFSVAFWMNPTAATLAGTGWIVPVDFRGSGTTGWSFTVGRNNTYNNEILAFVGAGPASWQRLVSGPLTPDEWVHVAMTYDDDSNFGRLYVDGALTSIVVADYVKNTAGNPLRIGRVNNTTSGSVGAAFDDLWVFDYALTDAEIQELMDSGTEPQRIQIPGDATGDGVVNVEDAQRLATNWGTSPATWSMGDFNKDGIVNAADASILAANWDSGTSESTGVPEPATPALLLAFLLCASRRSCRRG